MEGLFLKLAELSVKASFLIVAVLVFRLVFKKAPKWTFCIAWALVAVRLMCPFSFESIFSLVPQSATHIEEEAHGPAVSGPVTDGRVPQATDPVGGMAVPDRPVTDTPIESKPDTAVPSPPPAEEEDDAKQKAAYDLKALAAIVWAAGLGLMLLYAVFSYLKIRRAVREAAQSEDGILICDRIGTPFVLGLIRPRIYLPSVICGRDTDYVIAHERAHIRRGDHIWKPFGFLLLAVYWFNPLVWVAYVLLCRDIEYACDENVIKDRDCTYVKGYSEALINCSLRQRAIAACPLAFGGVSVKGRIKSILSYKKPTLYIIIAAIVATLAISATLLTDPKVKAAESADVSDSQQSSEEVFENEQSAESKEEGGTSSEDSQEGASSEESVPSTEGALKVYACDDLWLGYFSDDYLDLSSLALNKDTDPTYGPFIYRAKSKAELDDITKTFYTSHEVAVSVEQAFEERAYVDTFFVKRDLLIAYIDIGSSSNSVYFDSLTYCGTELSINISIYMPELANCDLNGCFLVFEVEKGATDSFTDFKVEATTLSERPGPDMPGNGGWITEDGTDKPSADYLEECFTEIPSGEIAILGSKTFSALYYGEVQEDPYEFPELIVNKQRYSYEPFMFIAKSKAEIDAVSAAFCTANSDMRKGVCFEEDYDEEFFDKRDLIVVYLFAESSSTEHYADRIAYRGKSLSLAITHHTPDHSNYDMAGSFVIVEVAKGALDGFDFYETVTRSLREPPADLGTPRQYLPIESCNIIGANRYDGADYMDLVLNPEGRNPYLFLAETESELEEISARFGGIKEFLGYDEDYEKILVSIEDMYSKDFFSENSLLILYLSGHTGSARLSLSSLTYSGNRLTVNIGYYLPPMYTMDLTGSFVCVAVDKDLLADFTDFDASCVTYSLCE